MLRAMVSNDSGTQPSLLPTPQSQNKTCASQGALDFNNITRSRSSDFQMTFQWQKHLS
jgi:hypothetical protein